MSMEQPEPERKQPQPSFKKDEGIVYEFSLTYPSQTVEPVLKVKEPEDLAETEQDNEPREYRRPSMQQMAKAFHLSPATVWKELHFHNDEIDRIGYCSKCRRADPNSPHVMRKMDFSRRR